MGAPLMKLFKANQLQSEEDRARDNRLSAIASRYRTDSSRDAQRATRASEAAQ
jgi:hypothetical protein